LDRLIKAISFIDHVHLVIAGNDEEDYLPELQCLVTENKLESRVSFVSRNVSGADKEALFAAAKVFVLPSYSENFGNTVLEAMIRSVPVVVTHEVGAADLVRQAQAGYVVTVEHLPETITSLLNDSLLATRMGEQGQIWARENLQWDQVAAGMAGEYQRILEGVSSIG